MKTKMISTKAPHALLVLTALLSLSACTEEDKNVESTMYEKQEPKTDKMKAQENLPTELKAEPVTQAEAKEVSLNDSVTLKGSIIYKELEGGFFAFITEDGDRFTLHGLDKEYHQNGLIVEIEGVTKPEMMTITQFGTVLEVLNVKVLDTSKVINRVETQ
ncbi:ribose-phosphate pyrophosphokinase [Alteromonas sp. BMJM2]|uniref:ribose-phosphate pyrophosphokinase n=1 Tax=Alteromonas sp. BMJM2 TaxID=2954241 RepID=UPI0022B4829E|nr:ribose-phosphate pyrophosphokinase [Alteromonas sp. BMJM2]